MKMMFVFFLPILPFLPSSNLGALLSFIMYSFVSNVLMLASFSLIAKLKLKRKIIWILNISILLIFLDVASFVFHIPVYRLQEILMWKLTGDYRVMYELSKLNFLSISGETLTHIFTAIATIPGSILMGYVSSFAFESPTRVLRENIIYWLVLNAITCFYVLQLAGVYFCGFTPWQC